LSSTVNQVQNQRDHSKEDKYPGKQCQGSQQFLNEINLQGDKGSDRNPYPLAGASFTEDGDQLVVRSLSQGLIGLVNLLHWVEPFPGNAELDAMYHLHDATIIHNLNLKNLLLHGTKQGFILWLAGGNY